jgi:aminoglycoside phosphotransferase (APT) family kinase protein
MNDSANANAITAALGAMGLMRPGEEVSIRNLSGGVSCDVFAVRLGARAFCVKRALDKLRVAADWRAPAERSEAEVAWLRLVAGIELKWVPQVFGEDRAQHLFVMEFFPPERYPVWKALLAAGTADAAFAAKVGAALGRIHAHTAGRADFAAEFANDDQFRALRIEPYLLHAAGKNPDIAPAIRALADGVTSARIALMHGDVSPKNILCGPDGPVFLDAETACYGDPAFDLAFCLNHLLLKAVWHREFARDYARSFAALAQAYLAHVDWEEPAGLNRRAAALLAALLLARVDGKSPVEYLTAERDKDFVRAQAKMFLARPPASVHDLAAAWYGAVTDQK